MVLIRIVDLIRSVPHVCCLRRNAELHMLALFRGAGAISVGRTNVEHKDGGSGVLDTHSVCFSSMFSSPPQLAAISFGNVFPIRSRIIARTMAMMKPSWVGSSLAVKVFLARNPR